MHFACLGSLRSLWGCYALDSLAPMLLVDASLTSPMHRQKKRQINASLSQVFSQEFSPPCLEILCLAHDSRLFLFPRIIHAEGLSDITCCCRGLAVEGPRQALWQRYIKSSRTDSEGVCKGLLSEMGKKFGRQEKRINFPRPAILQLWEELVDI